MLDKFLSYINQEKLFSTSDKILLAVSGGMDSMAMLHLFRLSRIAIGVAHINHNLRGNESKDDENFIKKYCEIHQINYYVDSIDPSSFDGQNMHDIARKHRYAFFDRIALEHNYNAVATAHHQDDVVETFMMNIMRGAGLNGLTSIPNKRQNIVRPLLFASRSEIDSFVKTQNIPYREDSSNSSDKYLRNKLRHHILPAIYELDSRAVLGIPHTISNIKSSYELLIELIEIVKKDVAHYQNDGITIDLAKIKKLHNATSFLFQILQEYGYNYHQCSDILSAHDQNSSIFLTNKYEALLDRKKLYIRTIQTKTDDTLIYQLYINNEVVIGSKRIKLEILDSHDMRFDANNSLQCICIDHLTLPFTIRKWQAGDSFAPLGMSGKKQKVKDFLTNIKLSLYEKSNVVVVLSGEKIIAIPGYRIAEDVKITPESIRIAKISIKDCK